MSEWRWCLDCQHSYEDHKLPQVEGERFQLGACHHGDCDCERFSQEVANF